MSGWAIWPPFLKSAFVEPPHPEPLVLPALHFLFLGLQGPPFCLSTVYTI